jgi:hypothetical protein
MGWCIRGDRKYYYRAFRVGGRPTREYLGAGEAAFHAAARIECRRAERSAHAEAGRHHRQQYEQAAAPLVDVSQLTELLAKGTLIALGYHQHDRTWRKRRDRARPT